MAQVRRYSNMQDVARDLLNEAIAYAEWVQSHHDELSPDAFALADGLQLLIQVLTFQAGVLVELVKVTSAKDA